MLEILASRLGWKMILLKSGVKMRFAVCGEYHLLALLPLRALFGFLPVEGVASLLLAWGSCSLGCTPRIMERK
jgi:hypothetical protein